MARRARLSRSDADVADPRLGDEVRLRPGFARAPTGVLHPSQVLALQRTAGNRQVSEMLLGAPTTRALQRTIRIRLSADAEPLELDDKGIAKYKAEIAQAGGKDYDVERLWPAILEMAESGFPSPDEPGAYESWTALLRAVAGSTPSEAAEESRKKLKEVQAQINSIYDPSSYTVKAEDPNEAALEAVKNFRRLWRTLQGLKVEGQYSKTIDELKDVGLQLVAKFGRYLRQVRLRSAHAGLTGVNVPAEGGGTVFDTVMTKLHGIDYINILTDAWKSKLEQYVPKTSTEAYQCHQDAAKHILAILDQLGLEED